MKLETLKLNFHEGFLRIPKVSIHPDEIGLIFSLKEFTSIRLLRKLFLSAPLNFDNLFHNRKSLLNWIFMINEVIIKSLSSFIRIVSMSTIELSPPPEPADNHGRRA